MNLPLMCAAPFALAAATPAAPAPSSLDIPVNWFDLIVLVIVIAGILVGRKRGMSSEFLDLLQWIAIIVAGALLYKPVGQLLSQASGFSLLWAYIIVYVLIGLTMKVIFGVFKRGVGQKLVGSDAFGNTEYYLGMTAGAIRFACVLIAVLALLNARLYTDAELDAEAKEMAKNFESVTFPTLGTIQRDVFRGSFSGRLLKHYVPMLLIEGTTPGSARTGETIGQRQQRQMDSITGK